jgi:putative ABC transport system permease protein
MNAIDVTLTEVALSLVLVAIAIAVSRRQRTDLEADLGIAVVRSFVQLTAVGYVIQAVFDSDSLWVVVALLSAMVVLATFTARSRARAVPGALVPLAIALATAAAVTFGLIVALGVFEPEPRYLVPVGGIVIGNAMTAAAVALNRLGDEVTSRRNEVEATLALGATSRQASAGLVSRSLRSAMIPLVDQTKTTGLIAFPGIMVGMLLGGAEPLDAVRLQLVILWVLLGAVSLAALIATTLGVRGFFTAAHQLREIA